MWFGYPEYYAVQTLGELKFDIVVKSRANVSRLTWKFFTNEMRARWDRFLKSLRYQLSDYTLDPVEEEGKCDFAPV